MICRPCWAAHASLAVPCMDCQRLAHRWQRNLWHFMCGCARLVSTGLRGRNGPTWRLLRLACQQPSGPRQSAVSLPCCGYVGAIVEPTVSPCGPRQVQTRYEGLLAWATLLCAPAVWGNESWPGLANMRCTTFLGALTASSVWKSWKPKWTAASSHHHLLDELHGEALAGSSSETVWSQRDSLF